MPAARLGHRLRNMANYLNESLATAERPRDYAGLLWIFAAGILGFGMFCATSAVALSDSSVQEPIAVAPGDLVNRAFSDLNTAAALTAQAFAQYIPTETITPSFTPTNTATFTSTPTPTATATRTRVFFTRTPTRAPIQPTSVPPRPTNTPIPVIPDTPTSQPPSPTNQPPTEEPCFCTDTPAPPPPTDPPPPPPTDTP